MGAHYRCRNSILYVVEESRQTSSTVSINVPAARSTIRLSKPTSAVWPMCASRRQSSPRFLILVVLVSAVKMFPLDRHQHLSRHSSHWIPGESKGIDQAWLPNASCSRAQLGSMWLSFQCPATLYPTECNSWGGRPTRCVHSSSYFADEL